MSHEATPLAMLPEVSLVTSWRVPMPQNDEDLAAGRLPGVYRALREGIALLDLYLLEHREIPLYAARMGTQPLPEPQTFLASLEPTHVKKLAKWLKEELVTHYSGRAIGRRPRWGALATFFPGISVPDPEARRTAVKALRVSLYLAHLLGCSCVEAVGGSCTPPTPSNATHEAYRLLREETLVHSLQDVFDLSDTSNPLCEIRSELPLPVLALELEPGPSFLLNEIAVYQRVWEALKDTPAHERVYLNADIAHFFLCGYYTPAALGGMEERIAHFHISDHAADLVGGGTHASDLVPGLYHSEQDYLPWLRFAIERTRQPEVRFSRMLAVELEACHQIEDVLAAQSIVRRWLLRAAEAPRPEERERTPVFTGAILTVDLGNSTKNILGVGEAREAAERLQSLLAALCAFVQQAGGTVLSFTGDGFIALVKPLYHPNEAAKIALHITEALPDRLRTLLGESLQAISLRCALHWGEVYIPNAGPLREQAIGRDVVCATRLCDWTKELEREQELREKRLRRRLGEHTYTVLSEAFYQQLEEEAPSQCASWQLFGEELELKGLPGTYKVYLPPEPS